MFMANDDLFPTEQLREMLEEPITLGQDDYRSIGSEALDLLVLMARHPDALWLRARMAGIENLYEVFLCENEYLADADYERLMGWAEEVDEHLRERALIHLASNPATPESVLVRIAERTVPQDANMWHRLSRHPKSGKTLWSYVIEREDISEYSKGVAKTRMASDGGSEQFVY